MNDDMIATELEGWWARVNDIAVQEPDWQTPDKPNAFRGWPYVAAFWVVVVAGILIAVRYFRAGGVMPDRKEEMKSEHQPLSTLYYDDKYEKAKREKIAVRRTMFLWTPLAGVVSLAASIVFDRNVFWPLWAFLVLVGWCYEAGRVE